MSTDIGGNMKNTEWLVEENRSLPAKSCRRIRFPIGLILVILAAVIFLGVKNRDGISSFLGGIFGGDGTSMPQTTETEEECSSEETEETETSEGSVNDTADGTDNGDIQDSSDTEAKPNIEYADMSQSEMGEGYVVNYTNRLFDIFGILEEGFEDSKSNYSERPIVLLYHSHTSEKYADAKGEDDVFCSVVAIGEIIAKELNSRGIPCVHSTAIHDNGNDPAKAAEDTVRTMLEIYPSISYIIDIHRLSGEESENKATLSSDGSAQLRLTVSEGSVYTRENIALALALRRKLNGDIKATCLPVVISDSDYHSKLAKYYLKVDVGSEYNLLSECIEAGKRLAKAIEDVLR